MRRKMILNKQDVQVPDSLKDAPAKVIDLYVQYKQISHLIDTHPERMQQVENEEGDSITFDCAAPKNILSRRINKYKISDIEKERLYKIWDKVKKLICEKQKLSVQYKAELNRHSGSIVIETQSERLIELFGNFESYQSIKNKLKREGLIITIEQLKNIERKYKAQIEVLKHENANNFLKSGVGSKEYRRKVLDEMHYYYFTKWRMDGKQTDANMCLSIQRTVKDEEKDNNIHITLDGHIKIDAAINCHKTLEQLSGILLMQQITVNSAAFKLGKRPDKLLLALNNSHAARYAGFSKNQVPIKQEPTFSFLSQSVRSMDWQAIEKKHSIIEDAKIVEDLPADQPDPDEVRTGKRLHTQIKNKLNKLDNGIK